MQSIGRYFLNFNMWRKALTILPNVSKDEWRELGFVSRWLISTRAAVLVMTFISATLAGLFALRDNLFSLPLWIALTIGLVLAHASNNLLNDYVDFTRGVDEKNYFRAMYGPHPLTNQLMTKSQHLTYFIFTALFALGCGMYLLSQHAFDLSTWILLGAGAFFLLFYTWPLKQLALGEIAVLLVWGPLMVGGGYYVITHRWDWNIIAVSLTYAFGVTAVIFGKHIDKMQADRAKNILTLPSVLGERVARFVVIGLMLLPYLFIAVLVAIGYFSPLMFVIAFALPRLKQVLPAFLQPKPDERPADFPSGQGGWPLFFAPLSFWYNRSFGALLLAGLLADTISRISFPSLWR